MEFAREKHIADTVKVNEITRTYPGIWRYRSKRVYHRDDNILLAFSRSECFHRLSAGKESLMIHYREMYMDRERESNQEDGERGLNRDNQENTIDV